jgi:hypothetical protein
MTPTERYTTNLSKAQGIVPETYELLELWLAERARFFHVLFSERALSALKPKAAIN